MLPVMTEHSFVSEFAHSVSSIRTRGNSSEVDLSQRSLRLSTIVTASLPQSVHILVVKEMVLDLEAFLVWGDKSRGEERGCMRERPWPSEDEVLMAQDGGQLPLSSGERGNGLAGPQEGAGEPSGSGACRRPWKKGASRASRTELDVVG